MASTRLCMRRAPPRWVRSWDDSLKAAPQLFPIVPSSRPAPQPGRLGVLRLCGVLFHGDPAPTWPGAWDFLADYDGAGVDGVAVYALTGTWWDKTAGDPPAYIRQPFRRGGGSDPAHGHVWTWNGARALYDPDDPGQADKRLTLSPSFAWNPGRRNDAMPYVHLFLRDGRLEDAGDSTCTFSTDVGPPA